MKNIVELKNYYYSYDNKNNVFEKFNFIMPKNSFTTLLGNTSSGKTTLAKILSGIITGYGSYKFLGEEMNDSKLYFEDEVSVIIGEYNNKFTHNSVKEFLVFPLENLKYKKDEIEKSLSDIIRLLKLEKLIDQDTSELNYSEQQKIILAAALITKPKLLVLDDFFINTNIVLKKQILTLLKNMNSNSNLSVLNITHDINDAVFGTDIQILFNNKIVINSKYEELINYEKDLKKYHCELPQIIDLSNKLKCYNMINKIFINMDRLVKAIWK